MNYGNIKNIDIANGEGVRVSLFVSGCTHHCKHCFNPETWDFEGGEEFTEATVGEVIELCGKDHVKGLSILGGEPMHPNNQEGTTKLAKAFKAKFPNKDLWMWSGFSFDRDLRGKEALKYVDVLVDGQYVDALRNPMLKWKGSSNQRVIDIKQTLKSNEIKLLE